MSDDRYLKEIERSIRDITQLHPQFASTIDRLEKRLDELGSDIAVSDRKYHPAYWKYYAYQNLLIKLRLIIENNFHFVETLSLLATARYVFEALVWLRVLQKDERYGLVAYYELGLISVKQAKAQKRKIEDEIQFYEQMAKAEESMLQSRAKPQSTDAAHDFSKNGRLIAEDVDRRARREFNIYADQAKVNGYSFQAYLMREQGLPQIEERIAIVMKEHADLEAHLPANARPLTKQKWNWKKQAESVRMEKQYDFIYSYTSRMLHATPFSYAVNQKNLEFDEVYMFLEYIYVSLLDSVETVEKDIGTVQGD